jgi:hypothetical protein
MMTYEEYLKLVKQSQLESHKANMNIRGNNNMISTVYNSTSLYYLILSARRVCIYIAFIYLYYSFYKYLHIVCM